MNPLAEKNILLRSMKHLEEIVKIHQSSDRNTSRLVCDILRFLEALYRFVVSSMSMSIFCRVVFEIMEANIETRLRGQWLPVVMLDIEGGSKTGAKRCSVLLDIIEIFWRLQSPE